MITLSFIMGIIGASVALLIGILIFSEVESVIDCETVMSETAQIQCEKAKDTAWLVIAILPIALFFALFSIFGGLGGGDLEESTPRKRNLMEDLLRGNKRGLSLRERRKRSKEKQRLADEKMLREGSDLVQHSFLTNWFRRKK